MSILKLFHANKRGDEVKPEMAANTDNSVFFQLGTIYPQLRWQTAFQTQEKPPGRGGFHLF